MMRGKDQKNLKFYSETETESINTFDYKIKTLVLHLISLYFILINSISEFKRGLRMTGIEYLAGVGGYFSLPLGFSVISFIEIIYWLVVRLARNIIQN